MTVFESVYMYVFYRKNAILLKMRRSLIYLLQILSGLIITTQDILANTLTPYWQDVLKEHPTSLSFINENDEIKVIILRLLRLTFI